jgi:hypothetical protein
MSAAHNTSGQISTGQTATKDTVYFNTNMVCIQKDDFSPTHGIQSNFNQTRVLPIVGRTNRAEIAVQSIDLHTKTLPIFQPQVQLGTDVNRLIYEVGLSATWRNGLINLPQDGVMLDTLIYSPYEPVPTTDYRSTVYGENTFQNVPGASLSVTDSYNDTIDLKLIPTDVKDTGLSILFDYWQRRLTFYNEPTRSSFYNTCLTPVVVPSVKQRILGTSYASSGVNVGKMVVEVTSNAGFNINDRVRLFGLTNYHNVIRPVTQAYATVLDIVQFDSQTAPNVTGTHQSLLLDYPFDVLQANSFQILPLGIGNQSTITFQVGVGNGIKADVGQTILIQQAGSQPLDSRLNNVSFIVTQITGDSITCLCNFSNPQPVSTINGVQVVLISEFRTGYVINQAAKSGGHIEFLTNESEFKPMQLLGNFYDGQILEAEFSYPLFDFVVVSQPMNYGFLRGVEETSSQVWTELFPMSSAVELTVTNSTMGDGDAFNGYYRIAKRRLISNGGATPPTILYTFVPISKPLPGTGGNLVSLTGVNFSCSLAPNFFAFDTAANEVIQPISESRYTFMRNLGFVPTQSTVLGTPTYPPTATTPSLTWTRAYTVSWDLSAYRNLEWIPQDRTASVPGLPILRQDFGLESSSTYYNVYEFNKFISDCVNKATALCINDPQSQYATLESYSLNIQLSTLFSNYITIFTQPIQNFVWSSSKVYKFGEIAISGVNPSSFVFAATRAGTVQPQPKTAKSSPFWVYLGNVPYTTDSPNVPQYGLVLSYRSGGNGTEVIAKLKEQLPQRPDRELLLSSIPSALPLPLLKPFVNTIVTPKFQTQAPDFHYDELTLLSYVTYDGTGFGTINVTQNALLGTLSQDSIALYNYKRRSWGHQGSQNADELFTLESNTAFKFLMDNFPSYCIAYEDTLSEIRTGDSQPSVEYWIWDNSKLVDPRVGTGLYNISQSSESLSSCMSPVQSIVVLSENIPVLDELSSPIYYLTDSNSSAFVNKAETVSLTEKIIAEIYPLAGAPFNTRSIIKYTQDQLKFVSLLDTRLFKQLEYSVYFRHRITQQLVPLNISNYGSLNIKFVFRPIS